MEENEAWRGGMLRAGDLHDLLVANAEEMESTFEEALAANMHSSNILQMSKVSLIHSARSMRMLAKSLKPYLERMMDEDLAYDMNAVVSYIRVFEDTKEWVPTQDDFNTIYAVLAHNDIPTTAHWMYCELKSRSKDV